MTRREVARAVGVGKRSGQTCSLLAVRWEDRSVTLYLHGVPEDAVELPAAEWATLAGLPVRAA